MLACPLTLLMLHLTYPAQPLLHLLIVVPNDIFERDNTSYASSFGGGRCSLFLALEQVLNIGTDLLSLFERQRCLLRRVAKLWDEL
jgi:hypothetical protein